MIPVVCQACAPTHALMMEEQHNSTCCFIRCFIRYMSSIDRFYSTNCILSMESFKHSYRAPTNNLNSTLAGAADVDDTDSTWVMVDSPHIETNANGKNLLVCCVLVLRETIVDKLSRDVKIGSMEGSNLASVLLPVWRFDTVQWTTLMIHMHGLTTIPLYSFLMKVLLKSRRARNKVLMMKLQRNWSRLHLQMVYINNICLAIHFTDYYCVHPQINSCASKCSHTLLQCLFNRNKAKLFNFNFILHKPTGI